MKKLFLVIAAVFAMAATANAQDNALGVRLGGGQGYGAELSFQKGLGGNRLEIDLGMNLEDEFTAFSLTGVYQWTGEIAKGFGWYAGVGARLGYWNYDLDGVDAEIALGLVGQAGIEYKFSAVPIQLSLDIRPCFYIIPETDFHWGDIALGIRYCF
ncbi:MAG: hypothetical protein IKN84_01820 [Bacteroidales bacterium]|jgi:hypothetical protein|nr:hypothetical protein [Bacteroidales bacterium]